MKQQKEGNETMKRERESIKRKIRPDRERGLNRRTSPERNRFREAWLFDFSRTRLQDETLLRNFVSLRLEGIESSIVENPQANFSDISFRTSYFRAARNCNLSNVCESLLLNIDEKVGSG